MKNGYNHKIITIINQNDSKYGNKMENIYSHKILTKINQKDSNYGNKIGSEIGIKFECRPVSYFL